MRGINKADYKKYTLKFRNPSGTSRGVLTEKTTYFLKIWEEQSSSVMGIGECSILKDLSIDDVENYEDILTDVCRNINDHTQDYKNKLIKFPK